MDCAVVLYTITDNDLRNTFAEILSDQGFEKHPDQSTFTYPMKGGRQVFGIRVFSEWLEEWSKDRNWSDSDFVSIYYLDWIEEGDFYTIKNISFKL